MVQRQNKGVLSNIARVWLAFVLCLFPVIVLAQDGRPLIDWDVVFAENEEKIEKKTIGGGTIVDELVLPSGIVAEKIYAADGVYYRVRDPNGAVGCLAIRYQYILATLEHCPVDRDSERGREIAMRFEKIMKFIEENSIPPFPEDELKRQFLKRREFLVEALKPRLGGPSCGVAYRLYPGLVTGEKAAALLPEILRVPRPPVVGDCL